MKKTIFTLLFSLLSSVLVAQNANDILGYWLNEEGDAKIEVYAKNNKFYGKIVWLKEPKDENGNWKLDVANPDKSLRHRKKVGLEIMHNLVWDEDEKEWNGGLIYDARGGDTYSLFATLKNHNTLNLRGFVGFSLFGKTTRWTKSSL